MKHYSDKIYILAVILIVIISAFLYKSYSTNLQKEKEKEVIGAQLLKEMEIIKEKEKIDQRAEQENQIKAENQKKQLNSCLQGVVDYSEEVIEKVLTPSYNRCVEIGDRNPTSGSACLDDLRKKNIEHDSKVEKDEAECYERYPQK